jgi:hypothetical protein
MSNLKIKSLGLYSTVLGLLVTLSVGCKDKTHEEFCAQYNNDKATCIATTTKHKDGGTCKYENDKCVPVPGTPLHHVNSSTNTQTQNQNTKACEKLSETECMDSKDCMFDITNKSCGDAATKGLCANIQVPTTCGDDASCEWDGTVCKDKVGPPPPPPPATKTVNVFSVIQASKKMMRDDEPVNKVVVTGNKEWAYFSSNDNTKFTAFNVESADKMAANIKDPLKWTDTTVEALNTGLGDADGAVATAALNGNNRILRLEASQKGAVVSLVGPVGAQQGVFYMEGNDFKAAWKNDAGVGRDIDPTMIVDATTVLHGMVMTKTTGEQFMMLCSVFAANHFRCRTGGADLNGTADIKVRLNQTVDQAGAPLDLLPFHVPGFLVSYEGIVAIKDDQIGVAQNFPKAHDDDKDTGSVAWTLRGANTANYMVSAVAAVGNKVAIGLHKNDLVAHTGGVVFFDPTAKFGKQVTPPKGNYWNDVDVIGLTVDANGSLWAVTPKSIIKVGNNTKPEMIIDKNFMMAQQFTRNYDQETEGATRFDGDMDKCDDITSAIFVGPHMMVATANDGLYFMMSKTEVVKQ